MDYLTVKETAQRWGVSVRTVNMHLNAGRVPGAVRKEHGWLVPAEAKKPADRRHRQAEETLVSVRCKKSFMPILSMTFATGSFAEAVGQLEDEEERLAAWAGHYYFRGEVEKTIELAERCFASDSAEIRLSARWLHAMAAIGIGDEETCLADFAEIIREGETASDEAVRAESEFIRLVAKIYFHEENTDVAQLMPHFSHLSKGVRCFALYGRAHALYLRKEYHQTIGEVEAASALMQQAYPVAAIYLNIVGAMASNSLARHEDAQRFFDRAWTLALPEGYMEPFAEHHGMLQGLVERKLRDTQPELYQKLSALVYRFSRGWMKIHNPTSTLKVTDTLTPYEFSIAMLAAKGRTNKEIADYMCISVNSVKAYLATIYQKIGITKRSELKNYVNY